MFLGVGRKDRLQHQVDARLTGKGRRQAKILHQRGVKPLLIGGIERIGKEKFNGDRELRIVEQLPIAGGGAPMHSRARAEQSLGDFSIVTLMFAG